MTLQKLHHLEMLREKQYFYKTQYAICHETFILYTSFEVQLSYLSSLKACGRGVTTLLTGIGTLTTGPLIALWRSWPIDLIIINGRRSVVLSKELGPLKRYEFLGNLNRLKWPLLAPDRLLCCCDKFCKNLKRLTVKARFFILPPFRTRRLPSQLNEE